MNRPIFAALAVGLFCMGAATAAPLSLEAADAATAARGAPSVSERDRPLPPRSVVAPPKPKVETIVQPGLDKVKKHERVSDVLRARKRAGGSGLAVAQ